MKGVMIQGTSSDSGKSFIVTALCRILSDMGYKVCPFKSQNMSNNSYVTLDGGEIGRAQGAQAEAARALPQTFMNPILLKPRMDTSSEIVLMGHAIDSPGDFAHYRKFASSLGIETVRSCLKHIDKNFDTIVIEGAGSPAEVNLNDDEIVNMRISHEADVSVILVTDVDRGGAIASVVGTLELLGAHRSRVAGIIFNKFRGDIAHFQDAVKFTEEYTGVPVVGVVPYIGGITVAGEDSLSVNWEGGPGPVTIGVVHLPYVSNHTDFEAFRQEDDVRMVSVRPDTNLEVLSALIIPGTKSTMQDMKYLHDTGLAGKIQRFANTGRHVLGVCGGYQMLGVAIHDPHLRDNRTLDKIPGLGLLPVETDFDEIKTTRQRTGHALHPALGGMDVSGYEIHFGNTWGWADGYYHMFSLEGTSDGLGTADMKICGTYLHHVFHNDNFRNAWLNSVRTSCGYDTRPKTVSGEDAYDRLAAGILPHLDMDYIKKLIG